MRLFVLAAALAALSPAQDTPESLAYTSRKAALAAFRAAAGGEWIVQWHPATGTPSAIYGTGLPIADWQQNTLAAARVHANRLLQEHADLLGLGNCDFRETIGARMGRTWTFTFDQYFQGLPVIDGRADLRLNMKGVVAMLGSRAWTIPANFVTVPAIAAEVAQAAAWAQVGEPTGVPQPAAVAPPRLVVWGDIDAPTLVPVALAWEVAISNVDAQGQGPIGRWYIDARTGARLGWKNDKHECGMPGCTTSTHASATLAATSTASAMPPVPTTVTVMAWTRTGNDAFSALVNAPLPGLVLSVPGVGSVTTDANGQFTIDIAAAVNITVGNLDGRHHNVMNGANPPAGVFAVNPGVPTTIQLLTAAATTNEAAHPTTSWWTDATNEFLRSIVGNTPQLAIIDNITPTVNIASTCNAYYTNNTINFYAAGGGCSNTAFSTVVAHEWGHGIDQQYGGIFNSNAEGLSEGWGDIIGLYLVDSPILGSGFQTSGVGIRNGNNTFLYPYSSTSPHGAGQVWMGFAWKLRERLRTAYGTATAKLISNDIVISTLAANATNRVDAVREVFIADDNDGNLLNGTPNYVQLEGAALDKAIPYPAIQVASIAHTPLQSTTQRLTPRTVVATVTPIGAGSITQVRLHFNAGTGNVVRNMHANGAANGYVAMLPGLSVGGVSYHIEAVHSSAAIARLPASGEYSYSIDGGTFAGFYSEQFDSGAAGWTNGVVSGTNDWQLGDPAGKTSAVSGVTWVDPQNAVSGLNVYATDLGIGTSNGRYPNSCNEWLRSPVINCTGRFGVRLRFSRWLSVEEGIYDDATIWCNGVQVWGNPTNGHLLDTAWQTVEYALPMADNNPSVQVEWRLVADAGLNLGGWQIDNVQLGETIAPIVDCELTMLPEQAVQGAAMNALVVTPGNSRPFLLAVADTAGPTTVPGFPTMAVGGNIVLLGSSTDATGNAAFGFTAPTVPSAIGVFFYSQVLTVDSGFTQFVTSNPHINLFTQTP